MPTNRATGPAAPATEPTVPPTTPEAEETPQYATKEEIQQMAAKMDKLFGTLGSVLEKVSGAKGKKQEEEKDATLTERIKKIEAREEAVRHRSARDLIASALVATGVDAAVAAKQAKYLYSVEFDGKVRVDDDGAAFFADGDREVSITDHVKAYLQTEDGKWLLPAKRPPTDRGAASGRAAPQSQSGVREIAWGDYMNRRMTAQDIADLKSGKATISPPE